MTNYRPTMTLEGMVKIDTIPEWRAFIGPALATYKRRVHEDRNPKSTSWGARMLSGLFGSNSKADTNALFSNVATADILPEIKASTKATFDPLIERRLAANPANLASFKQSCAMERKIENRIKLREQALDHVHALNGALKSCIRECSEAETGEYLDGGTSLASMFAGPVAALLATGANVYSHFETEEAKDAMQNLGRQLASFTQFAKANPDIFPGKPQGMSQARFDTNDISVWGDMLLGGGFGAYFSYGNAEVLDTAQKKAAALLNLTEKLGPSLEQTITAEKAHIKQQTAVLDKYRMGQIEKMAPQLGLNDQDLGYAKSLLTPAQQAPQRAMRADTRRA